MTKRKKPKFPTVPTKAYQMQRSDDYDRTVALAEAINRSPCQARFDKLEEFLDFAEPWVDRDILRANLLANGDLPANMQCVLAFVRGGDLIGPSEWSMMLSSEMSSEERPLQCFVVGTPGPIYDMAAELGGLVIGLWAEGIRLALARRITLTEQAMVEWIRRKVEERKRKP